MISFVVTAAAATRCGRTATELLPAGAPVPTRVTSPTPHTFVPAALDWRAVNGTAFTTRVGYQLIPSPCGSCWAFAATGALSDRIKIATGGLLPDVNLSPQALLDCGASATPSTGSCNGGNPKLAYEFMANTGITDETCSPYQGVDNTNWAEIKCADRMCRRCDRFGTCRFLPANESMVIKVQEHGTVKGVDAMKAEIAARGPIACLMYAHADAFEAYTGGIISDTTKYPGITHGARAPGQPPSARPIPMTTPKRLVSFRRLRPVLRIPNATEGSRAARPRPQPARIAGPPRSRSRSRDRHGLGRRHGHAEELLGREELVRDRLGRARLLQAGDRPRCVQHGEPRLLVGDADGGEPRRDQAPLCPLKQRRSTMCVRVV